MFKNLKNFRDILIIVDFPKTNKKDNKEWKWRRDFAKKLSEKINAKIVYYPSTFQHNANLPLFCYFNNKKENLENLLSKNKVVIALTEFSATAPLKKFCNKFNLKAISMPGFNKCMLPSLELDYKKVKIEVDLLYNKLKNRKNITYIFNVKNKKYYFKADLTKCKFLKDDGVLKKGVINMPSGEVFVAPKNSNGFLPIQLKNKVYVFKVKNNQIVEGKGELWEKIKEDPAIGNIAELGFGVLGKFGIRSCGKILLDEKLGPHIALGRNDHFGGKVGPEKFKKKENIWHQDFVYTKEMQPLIKLKINNLEFFK